MKRLVFWLGMDDRINAVLHQQSHGGGGFYLKQVSK